MSGARQVWRRLGRAFAPEARRPWLHSHASCPTPLVLSEDRVRVYFSPRDAGGHSCIASVDLAIDGERHEVVGLCEEPWLLPGPRGAFDDSGVTIGAVVRGPTGLRAYYLGWSLGVTVPYRNFIGLALEQPAGGPWRRLCPAPVIDRSAEDAFTLSYPWVLREGGEWRAWYGSHRDWGADDRPAAHVLRAARSTDGVQWRREPGDLLGESHLPGIGSTRPCVLREGGRWRLWYSRRSIQDPAYSVAYAESADGESWQSRPSAVHVVPQSDEAWDEGVMAYASVFRLAGRLYMLYNGAGYGRDGFGLALLDPE